MPVDKVKEETLSEVQKFRQDLIKFLKTYTRFTTPSNGMRCIRSSQERFSEHLTDKRKAKIYMEAIFVIIELFCVTDSDLIRNALEEYSLLILSYFSIVKVPLEPPSLFRRLPKNGITYELPEDNARRVLTFSTNSFLYYNDVLFYPTVTQTLLRHGVRFDPKLEDLLHYQDTNLTVRLMGTRVATFTDTEEEREQIRAVLNEHYPTYHDKRRIYFMLMQMQILWLRKLTDKNDDLWELFKKWKNFNRKLYMAFRKSVQLVYMTITDPEITVAEVQRFLQIVLMGKAEENKIKNYCERFVKIFPTSDQPIQPRSLQHLCCCHVRESLIRARKLPYGIKNLHLPKSIRNYLLVQKDENEFVPKFLTHDVPEKRSDFEHRRSKRLKASRAQ